MSLEKVSIIVPCYNQAKYLNEALQSVQEQTYANWECIIVNDGSLDETEEIVQEWVAKDTRFSYLKKENGGLSSARNFGISSSKGEFILPLDADDKIAHNYVGLAIRSFEEDPSLKVVYCRAEKFGDGTGIWQLQPFSLLNLCSNNMIFCSAMYKKQDWELAGGYDEKMSFGWEDWEFWISILKNGGNVKCLDEVGFYYRIKSNSMVKLLDEDKKKYLLEYMSIKHVDFFVEQLGSFKYLNDTLEKTRVAYFNNLKSEKFTIDLFCSTFFGFSIFGLYKIKKH
jgi:glycosyltransferase involved in cell wall biosynthesis